MGECGCGAFGANAKFPAPDGQIYFVQIVDSCRECETPAGIKIHRMSKAESRRWGADRGVPDLEFWDFGEVHEAVIPVLDPRKLLKRIETFAKKCKPDEYDYDGFAHDALSSVFRDAVWDTWNKFMEMVKVRDKNEKKKKGGGP